jgi:hypothetical protein
MIDFDMPECITDDTAHVLLDRIDRRLQASSDPNYALRQIRDDLNGAWIAYYTQPPELRARRFPAFAIAVQRARDALREHAQQHACQAQGEGEASLWSSVSAPHGPGGLAEPRRGMQRMTHRTPARRGGGRVETHAGLVTSTP